MIHRPVKVISANSIPASATEPKTSGGYYEEDVARFESGGGLYK